jgi:hypothetical protein
MVVFDAYCILRFSVNTTGMTPQDCQCNFYRKRKVCTCQTRSIFVHFFKLLSPTAASGVVAHRVVSYTSICVSRFFFVKAPIAMLEM